MAATIPRQLDLSLCRRLLALGGDTDHPHLAIGPNVLVGRDDHSRSALAVAALGVKQLHPDDAATAEP